MRQPQPCRWHYFRFRENDVPTVAAVIPAQAGIHGRLPRAYDEAPDTPIAGAPSVIPAQAGIRGRSPIAHDGAPDTPIAGIAAVIPAERDLTKAGSGNPYSLYRPRMRVSAGAAAQ